jgi:isoquinoline 1-oxidoreductase subunit alpha
MIDLSVNGKNYQTDVDPDTPLLWALRDHLKLVGTKLGCGIGACGSCTVHINGEAERSCRIAVGDVKGKSVTTIEGIPEDHPLKKAWIAEQVPQCGYCQPGQIMQAAAVPAGDPNPTEEKLLSVMDGVLCRCGTYPRIKKALKKAVKMKSSSTSGGGAVSHAENVAQRP